MGDSKSEINSNYEQFYARIKSSRVYPTEFVVRTFLANYPGLVFGKPKPGDAVLDVAFGDGRNTIFLCEQGYSVAGVEITQGIVDQTAQRLATLGLHADLRVGRNSNMPFEDATFDCILASHCIYYCDEGETLRDNLKEYARILKSGGHLVASVASRDSYIFEGARALPDGSLVIAQDPYSNRVGYRLFAFNTRSEIEEYFSPYFSNFSFGFADNEYYGIQERVFWVVCQKNP
jgi:ubiquinone/menaquinone biosynthesis C-methylase UbiE